MANAVHQCCESVYENCLNVCIVKDHDFYKVVLLESTSTLR